MENEEDKPAPQPAEESARAAEGNPSGEREPRAQPGRQGVEATRGDGFPLKTIFLGPHGIRAGWRLLLFLPAFVVFFLILTGLGQFLLAGKLGAGGAFSSGVVIMGEGLGFVAALSAALLMGAFEKRTLADYLLPVRAAFGARFWQGALWGFVALSALLGAMHLAHGFQFGALALHGSELISYAVAWLAAFVLVGLFEEFLVRGYALFTLTTGMGFWPSAVLLSAVFGAAHLRNPGEDWRGGLAAGLIGLFFCFTVRRTGTLWFAVGFHAAWDYSESFIYSVPNSGAIVPGHLMNSFFAGPAWLTGGGVGPEGSVLAFGVIAAVAVLFAKVHREVRFPRPPAAEAGISRGGLQAS
jgi:CAAX protease family protein